MFYSKKSRTGRIYVLNRHTHILVLLPIPLTAHTFPSFCSALKTLCSQFIISLLPPPSSSTVAPRYGNSLTPQHLLPPRHAPFTTMLSLLLAYSVLSVLHFLALSLKPTLAISSISLPVFSSKSFNLDDSRARSSVKWRFSNTFVKFHHIPVVLSAVAFLMIQFRASKKMNPDNTNPYLTLDLLEPVQCLTSVNNCSLMVLVYVCYHTHHRPKYPIASHDAG